MKSSGDEVWEDYGNRPGSVFQKVWSSESKALACYGAEGVRRT
jgi:hypothetical protein